MIYKKPDMDVIHPQPVDNIFTESGAFSDGRLYFAELWSDGEIEVITLYMSCEDFKISKAYKENITYNGKDNADKFDDVLEYLFAEGIIYSNYNKDYYCVMTVGNPDDKIISVNISTYYDFDDIQIERVNLF